MGWIRDRLYARELALICSIMIAPGEALYAQPAQPGPTEGNQPAQSLNTEQLDSMVAPIALYPDSLVAQILAASTYPLEIVTANRWVRENSTLKGKELVEAAGKQDWDPSIQALVAFPTVLDMLNQSLDWTTALGNAFLAQQSDVMAAVQRMRMKAQRSGTLQSNAQQQVQTTIADGEPTIEIQPSNPEVVYVPSYDPTIVYGAASAYYPYPAIGYPVGLGALSFGLGVAVGAIFNGCCGAGWGWGWGCNWGKHPSLYVNNNFFAHNGNTFVNRGNWGNAYAGNGKSGWNHNPRYRGAVPYSNREVANRYNGGRGGMRPAQLPTNMGNIRPPGSQGTANRLPGNIGPSAPGGGRGGVNPLPANPDMNRPGGRVTPGQLPGNAGANMPGGRAPSATGSANRVSPGGGQWGGWSGAKPSGGGAFAGGNAGQARQFSNRGAHSMGGGGFNRGGGGARGGGRRR
jgi:hypothetical protein